ncbi:MAG: 23S rRNA (guanosine(2251)-2'-O)-methyltransferase RlmB [Dongiaceae bacterium]
MPQSKNNRSRFHRPKASGPATGAPQSGGPGYWLYGLHPVIEALKNPRRRFHRLICARETVDKHLELLELAGRLSGRLTIEQVDRETLDRIGPAGTVHQGVAVRTEPLPMTDLYSVCDDFVPDRPAILIVLDQVTDPHNVGAILRSAAAFGAAALVVTERNAATESGTMAKAASGALEHVPLVPVTNLVRAIEMIKKAGLWCIGLAGNGAQTIAEAKFSERAALVLGSEGTGLRRLTRERCDLIVRLPTTGPIGQLNVSNAAAVALYEIARRSACLPLAGEAR